MEKKEGDIEDLTKPLPYTRQIGGWFNGEVSVVTSEAMKKQRKDGHYSKHAKKTDKS
jgi:hypothetical protein